MMPSAVLLLIAVQGAPPGPASFPDLAVGQLEGLHGGVTPALWLAAHPRDHFIPFSRDSIRENHERWCGRASAVWTRSDGTPVVRYAYFYPPRTPESLDLPATGGPTLIRERCVLGTVWLETLVPDSTSGAALATSVRDALTRVHGRVTPGPDVFLGPLPVDSQRRLLSRMPGAEAMLLGIHFFGAAGWRTPGRWQVDSTVVVSAHDAGLGSRRQGGGRVLAFAFLPVAELGSFRWVRDREEAAEDHTLALAAQAARLSGLSAARVGRLIGLAAAAESAFTGLHRAEPAALDSTAVAVLEDWIALGRPLPPTRNAAVLLAADQVLGSRALIYVRAQRDDSLVRRAFERLGAEFVRDQLGGGYNYTHTWLDAALRLDPHGPIGALATLALLRSGFNETGMCGGGEDPFRRVIATGEHVLAGAPDPTIAADVHRLVGDAYADIVALAAGAGLEYAEPATYLAEAPAARLKAVEHYRAALALDRTSLDARAAWLEGWRLLAGLPPTTTHFFCVYD